MEENMATKTTVPTKIIVDCSTGEQTEVDLTAEEIAQLELDQAQALAAQESAEAEAAARTAARLAAEQKLAALGLTAEEIAALGGN
jgi:hypothetical protein